MVKETISGSVKNRMRLFMKLRVEKVEFDSEQCSLRINGVNIEENEHIKLGQYHTLEVECHYNYSLHKECWDDLYLGI